MPPKKAALGQQGKSRWLRTADGFAVFEQRSLGCAF